MTRRCGTQPVCQHNSGSFDEGFTLIETLVALTASTMLLVVLGWMVMSIRTAWQLGATAGDQVNERAGLVLWLQTHIEQAQWQRTSESVRGIAGSSHGCSFVAPAPMAIREISRVVYQLRLTGESSTSSRLEVALMADDNSYTIPEVFRRPITLAHGLRSMELRYGKKTASNLEWRDRWSSDDRLPDLVEMELMYAGDDLPFVISIRPRLNAQGGCMFDPISMDCR